VNHNSDGPTGQAEANNPNWGWRLWCPFWFLFGQAKRNDKNIQLSKTNHATSVYGWFEPRVLWKIAVGL